MILEILSICAVILFGISAVVISAKKDRAEKSARDSIHTASEKPENQISNDKNLRDDYANIAVHELRAPLTSIKDSSELLLNHKYTLKDDEKEQFLKMINRQSHLLLDQVGSILDVAKLESGTFSLNRKPDTIDDLIYERIKIFPPQAERKNILLTCNIVNQLPPVNVDKVRIGQVLNNLISNSIKFTPEGGKIIVSASAIDNKDASQLQISVADTGHGIPKDKQGKIFTKFYQVKSDNGREEKNGTGLGLYITKKIIDAHGGSISIDSDQGRGTIMTFTLPIYKQEQAETVPHPASAPEVNPLAN